MDGKTDALFNKIVRESVVKVRWEVDWFEEDAPVDNAILPEQGGRWPQSCARYYLRIVNQVLVDIRERFKISRERFKMSSGKNHGFSLQNGF